MITKWIVFAAFVVGITSPLARLVDPIHFSLESPKQQETGSPILPPISAEWVASDGAGRTLPTFATTGNFKKNKYVGIFYFLVHGQYNDKAIYDITKLTKENPNNPKFGPETSWHWWGEPEVGYFKANDPWVIRRNLQLLTIAGVDILFFDVTNADIYLSTFNKICEISVNMRQNGMPTPYICFVTYTKSAQTVTDIYQKIYAQNKFSELWFRWQGKPLILGKKEEMLNTSIRDFFTWRYSWAWTNSRNEPHHWQWLDRTPQNYGWDIDPSIPEQIPVAVASHPFDNNIGKSFRQGSPGIINRQGVTAQTQQGLYFDEQWKRALQVDPSVVFVTGWNEWIGQRFVNKPDPNAKTKPANFMGKPLRPGQTFFVDLYSQEYNRDIDPMKGGYTDNYYYQLVANIRRYKGLPPPEQPSTPRTISIDGDFDEWEGIKPNFIDPANDVIHRNWPRADNKINYINNSGRNDIRFCRVTHDTKKAYFYVKTVQKLTPPSGKNWMLLFIDTDQMAKTGWQGYDYLIRPTANGQELSISKWNGRKWLPKAKGVMHYANSELELSLPLNTIQQTSSKVKFNFHWADNLQRLNNIIDFFLNGDSAPDRRFNYCYSER